jgi:hypothetical protein
VKVASHTGARRRRRRTLRIRAGDRRDQAIRTGKIAAEDSFVAEPFTVPMQELEPLKTQSVIHSVKRR